MGQSTDGIIFYGYCSVEEIDGDELGSEWAEKVLRQRGDVVYPYSLMGGYLSGSKEKTPDDKARVDVWYEALHALEEETDCGVDSHCSCEYPMPYIYLKGTEVTAWRGQPQTIHPAQMAAINVKKANASLNAFVELIGADISDKDTWQGPGWFLVSNWC